MDKLDIVRLFFDDNLSSFKVFTLGEKLTSDAVDALNAIADKTKYFDLFFDVDNCIDESNTPEDPYLFRPANHIPKSYGEIDFGMPEYRRYRFHVDLLCSRCQKLTEFHYSRAELKKVISEKELPVCPDCKRKEAEERRQQQEVAWKTPEERHRESVENAEKFISVYLNPANNWKNNTSVWDKIQILKRDIGNRDYVASYIKQMDYREFLATPYWKAISEYKRNRSGYKCSICGKPDTILNVHHNSYQNHGMELYHPEDLVCLCQECHSKFHDIIPESK